MGLGGCVWNVDCKNHNKYIVKSKFPIPAVEELLDELRGSKIDLRSDYHQLRIGVLKY